MSDPTIAAWHRQDELRKELQSMRQALEWISRRCPAQFLQQEPHRIHWEAAYDAGACARAALDKAGGEK
jgi:hypothetical protein